MQHIHLPSGLTGFRNSKTTMETAQSGREVYLLHGELERLKDKYTADGKTLIKPEKQARFLGVDEFKLHNGYKYASSSSTWRAGISCGSHTESASAPSMTSQIM